MGNCIRGLLLGALLYLILPAGDAKADECDECWGLICNVEATIALAGTVGALEDQGEGRIVDVAIDVQGAAGEDAPRAGERVTIIDYRSPWLTVGAGILVLQSIGSDGAPVLMAALPLDSAGRYSCDDTPIPSATVVSAAVRADCSKKLSRHSQVCSGGCSAAIGGGGAELLPVVLLAALVAGNRRYSRRSSEDCSLPQTGKSCCPPGTSR